ncbi:MAG: rhodanese-like domain-containing protein [Bacteroidales bacterium]
MEPIFENMGRCKDGIVTLTPREALKAINKGALFVDLRDTDFSDFKIPDIQDIFILPLDQLQENLDKIPRDRHLILADSSGLKSKEAVRILKDNGFENTANMAGGFIEWERDGLPVREDLNERLSGACACQLKPRERLKK